MKFTLLLLITISSTAFSHEFIGNILIQNHTENEQESGLENAYSYRIIKEYNLTATDIENYSNLIVARILNDEIILDQRTKCSTVNEDTTVNDICGVFDHFQQARLVANNICSSLSIANIGQYNNDLIPRFLGPETFIRTNGTHAEIDHHKNYSVSQGINFECVTLELNQSRMN